MGTAKSFGVVTQSPVCQKRMWEPRNASASALAPSLECRTYLGKYVNVTLIVGFLHTN